MKILIHSIRRKLPIVGIFVALNHVLISRSMHVLKFGVLDDYLNQSGARMVFDYLFSACATREYWAIFLVLSVIELKVFGFFTKPKS